MNINGFERRSMAKNLSPEEFLIHVANEMECQLQEWDSDNEVMVMKMGNYEFIVKNKETYYSVFCTEEELKNLQKESPYSLDQKLWRELQKEGLKIIKGIGNYIEFVM